MNCIKITVLIAVTVGCVQAHALSPGKSVRDPAGVLWTDLLRDQDQKFYVPTSFEDAELKCKSLGKRLPKLSEIVDLRSFLGGDGGSILGYRPGNLANMIGPYVIWTHVDQRVVDDENEFFEQQRQKGMPTPPSNSKLRHVLNERMVLYAGNGIVVPMSDPSRLAAFLKDNDFSMAVRCVSN